MRFREIVFVLLSCIGGNTLLGQVECFESLSEFPIKCLAETEDYLWVGTVNEGLYRYHKLDESWAQFTTSNSDLPRDDVKSLLNFEGEIYIASDSSIARVEGDTIIVHNDSIGGILCYGPTDRLAISNGQYYYEWELEDIVYTKAYADFGMLSCPSSNCDQSTDATHSESGELFISYYGFYTFFIFRYDGIDWTIDSQQSDPALPIESYTEFNRIESHDGQVYATAASQVFTYINDGWQATSTGLDEHPIELMEDPVEGLWLGSGYGPNPNSTAYISYLAGEWWQHFLLPDASSTTIHALQASITDQDIIYLGTNLGLLRLDKSCLDFQTSLTDAAKRKTAVYPNPTRGEIYLKGISGVEFYQIFDSNGRLISKGMYRGFGPIDLSLYATGQYKICFPNLTQCYMVHLN